MGLGQYTFFLHKLDVSGCETDFPVASWVLSHGWINDVYTLQEIHISPPWGKGKSSSNNAFFWGGYVIIPRRVFDSRIQNLCKLELHSWCILHLLHLP